MVNTVIGLAVLAWIVSGQVRSKSLDTSFVLPLILAVIGLAEFGALVEGGPDQFKAVVKGQRPFVVPNNIHALVIALVGSLLIAAVGAVARIPTIHLWRKDGQVWRRGNALTAILWVLALGVHLGYDAVVSHVTGIANLGAATMLLYFAVALSIQRGLLALRAQRT